MATSKVIYTTALDAWNGLNGCGLELGGRDIDLVELLHQKINPKASTLEAALAATTPERFVVAFLDVASPYVAMLKGILRLFENAGAKQGKDHWSIQFDDYLAEVEQFKEWEKTIRSIGIHVECPAISIRQWWGLMDVFQSNKLKNARTSAAQIASTKLSEATWPLQQPTAEHPVWMNDLWALCAYAQHVLARAGLNLHTAREVRGQPRNDADVFSLQTLCSTEHDFGISQLCGVYDELWKSNDATQQDDMAVREMLDAFPRKTVWLQADVEDLKQFLSLPIWQKRHEFYAAWIASEMVAQLKDGETVVHHDNGKITFPFKPTDIATLGSGVKLIAERRTQVKVLGGVGDTEGAQPDYGWWDGRSKDEVCVLVVEVKHYKKAAKKSWSEVLTRYASAHPFAPVLLVNYGPAGTALSTLPPSLAGRCQIIGNLYPGSADSLAEFAKALAVLKQQDGRPRAIVLDTSSSMKLKLRRLAAPLLSLAPDYPVTELIAVDSSIHDTLPLLGISDEDIQGLGRSIPEDLIKPILHILTGMPSLILVSDDVGAASIVDCPHFATEKLVIDRLPPDLVALRVSRDPSGN